MSISMIIRIIYLDTWQRKPNHGAQAFVTSNKYYLSQKCTYVYAVYVIIDLKSSVYSYLIASLVLSDMTSRVLPICHTVKFKNSEKKKKILKIINALS